MKKKYSINEFCTNGRLGVSLTLALFTMLCPLSAHAIVPAPATLPLIEAFPGANYQVLDPFEIPKYVQALVIPPVMPKSTDSKADYNIAMRQFQQQILPGGIWGNYGYPSTTVWSYGKAEDPYDLGYTAPMPLDGSLGTATTFNYPALTVEATQNRRTRVRWINDLRDPSTGNFLPHLLPVDRNLHWANPEQLPCKDGSIHTDCKPDPLAGPVLQEMYDGPVPIVTHVHGAHVNPESDGYPEAWWLPNANNIPAGYANKGGLYDQWDRTNSTPGSALFAYFNTQRASTIWYHDHGLGITRVNVYAGPAGFWLIRGKRVDEPDLLSGVLPGPAPVMGEDPNFDATVRSKIREVPIVIQGRTFTPDGQLFFPENRAYFEGLNKAGGVAPISPAPASELNIAFTPDTSVAGHTSDVAPIWNPEFFGNTMVVNGTTWPIYNVAPARYRLRFLNGCNARTLLLKMIDNTSLTALQADFDTNGAVTTLEPSALPFYQIGSDGGLLPLNPVQLDQLLMMPAERADVIVDFTGLSGGVYYLINEGPDEPFGGGAPTVDYDPSNPYSTGQVMKFVVDQPLDNNSTDPTASDPAGNDTSNGVLSFTQIADLLPDAPMRQVSLNELESESVFITVNSLGELVLDANGDVSECDPAIPLTGGDECVPFGPTEAKVGIVASDPNSLTGSVGIPLNWTDMTGESTMTKVFTKSNGAPVMVPVTEMPNLNDTEEWEIWNFTADAHPIHLHLVEFQIMERETLTPTSMTGFELSGNVMPRESWETGWKDTVISYPGEVTRIRAKFDVAGLYVWHCHIIDHEDNEMMRPMAVVPDLNGDSCVDRRDLRILLRDIRRRGNNYDLNGDGRENARDARRLTKFFTNPRGRRCL